MKTWISFIWRKEIRNAEIYSTGSSHLFFFCSICLRNLMYLNFIAFLSFLVFRSFSHFPLILFFSASVFRLHLFTPLSIYMRASNFFPSLDFIFVFLLLQLLSIFSIYSFHIFLFFFFMAPPISSRYYHVSFLVRKHNRFQDWSPAERCNGRKCIDDICFFKHLLKTKSWKRVVYTNIFAHPAAALEYSNCTPIEG